MEAYIGPHYDHVASQASPTTVTTTGSGGVEIDATLTTVPQAQALMVNLGLLAAGGFTKRDGDLEQQLRSPTSATAPSSTRRTTAP